MVEAPIASYSLRWRLHHTHETANSRNGSLDNGPPEADFFLDFDTRNAIFLKEIDGNDRRRRKFWEILTPEMQFSLRKSMDLK